MTAVQSSPEHAVSWSVQEVFFISQAAFTASFSDFFFMYAPLQLSLSDGDTQVHYQLNMDP